jgi:hypothetical protein
MLFLSKRIIRHTIHDFLEPISGRPAKQNLQNHVLHITDHLGAKKKKKNLQCNNEYQDWKVAEIMRLF